MASLINACRRMPGRALTIVMGRLPKLWHSAPVLLTRKRTASCHAEWDHAMHGCLSLPRTLGFAARNKLSTTHQVATNSHRRIRVVFR